MRIIMALAILTLSLGASARAQDIEHYWVYCINDETSVEMWDLEQMKVRRGRDVCQLYQDTSSSGAHEWMDKNFPTHKCWCHNQY